MDSFARHYALHFKQAANWPLLRGLGGAAAGGASGYGLSQVQGYDPLATTTSIMLNAATGAEIANHPGLVRDPKFLTMAAGKEIVPQAVTMLHAGAHATDRWADSLPPAASGGAGGGALDYLKNNPGAVAKGLGATALGGAGLYALVQAARAAKRLGDGHAIRVSTSLRKRPGQATDLNLGISPQGQSRLPNRGSKALAEQDGPGPEEED